MASVSKRASGAWQNTNYGIRATATDTITTLPATIYGDGTPLIDYLISGNTTQSGTPTPDSPIIPQGCGEVETAGAKAGQYKIPISSASTTAPVYLGDVETTRRVKKLVLSGEEEWQFFSDSIGSWQLYISNISLGGVAQSSCVSNIAPYGVTVTTRHRYDYGCYIITSGSGIAFQMKGAKDTFTGITAWKSYLAQQYAAGTPVTVWYVLSESQTAAVNEPLMRIGDYADTLSKSQAGVAIPTNNGSTTIDVDTTVKPSEVSINYHGWHMGTVHERTSGQWD